MHVKAKIISIFPAYFLAEYFADPLKVSATLILLYFARADGFECNIHILMRYLAVSPLSAS